MGLAATCLAVAYFSLIFSCMSSLERPFCVVGANSFTYSRQINTKVRSPSDASARTGLLELKQMQLAFLSQALQTRAE